MVLLRLLGHLECKVANLHEVIEKSSFAIVNFECGLGSSFNAFACVLDTFVVYDL